MEKFNLQTWDECKEKLRELQEWRRGILERLRADGNPSEVPELLFRGQLDACWELDTTLERFFGRDMSVHQYYMRTLEATPQVEVFTDSTWNIPPRSKFEEWLKEADFFMSPKPFAYDYLSYLRHHGFPSPLLDWTRSPYVAAFFAFHGAFRKKGRAAIYCYCEHTGEDKSQAGDQSIITRLPRYVKSHRRHFLQQSEYTICTKKEEHDHRFVWHGEVFSRSKKDQDLLWKMTVPSSEALCALRELDSMNINAFSLFGSEEGLASTIAFRQFHFDE